MAGQNSHLEGEPGEDEDQRVGSICCSNCRKCLDENLLATSAGLESLTLSQLADENKTFLRKTLAQHNRGLKVRNEGLEKRAATNRFLINQLQREIVELKALVTVPVSKPNLAPAGHDGGRRINRERRSLTQPNLGSIDLSRLSPQEYAAKKIQKFFRHFRLRSRWKEIVSNLVTSPEAKSFRARNFVIREIIETERTYVTQLHTITEVYIKPLRYASVGTNSIIGASDISTIFCNWETLTFIHKVFLAEMEKRLESYPNVRLAELFLQTAPIMQAYTVYINNFEVARGVLQSHLDSSRHALHHFIRRRRADPRMKNMTLKDFLIMPVQRIPRYVLLLNDLVNRTSEGHVEYGLLVDALQTMKAIAKQINENASTEINRQKVAQLQSAVHHPQFSLALDDGTRSFVAETSVLVARKVGQKARSRELVLLSDLLLILSKKKSGMLEPKEIIRLNQTTVELDQSNALIVILRLSSATARCVEGGKGSGLEIQLHFGSDKEATAWQEIIDKAKISLGEALSPEPLSLSSS